MTHRVEYTKDREWLNQDRSSEAAIFLDTCAYKFKKDKSGHFDGSLSIRDCTRSVYLEFHADLKKDNQIAALRKKINKIRKFVDNLDRDLNKAIHMNENGLWDEECKS